jgi:arylsulfatase A-like enzyme
LVAFINGRPGEPSFQTIPERAGEHLLDGVCAIAGAGVRVDGQMHRVDITDVAPTVLALLDVPVPDDMDGRVLTEAFTEPPTVSVQPATSEPGGADKEQVFSEAEQQEIERRLRNLGYLE